MARGLGKFGSIVSKYVLSRLGMEHTTTASKLTSKLMIGALFGFGSLCLLLPSVKGLQDLKDFWITVGGALIGAGVALWTSLLLCQDEEMVTLVAAGAMAKSSEDADTVKLYQKTFVMLYTTRNEQGIIGLSNGFYWKKALIDLTAPAPGKLLGTFHTTHATTGKEQTHVVEGYLRHKLLVIHVIGHPHKEGIEATFVFPLILQGGDPAYGSGYHTTNADLGDIALSPAILCEYDEEKHLCALETGQLLPPGKILTPAVQYRLDNAWWSHHKVNFLPRIYPQVSATHAPPVNLNGEWLFRFMLVYDECAEPVHLGMTIQKSGARCLISPSVRGTPPEFRQPIVHGSIQWMAEMRTLHPQCMTGRWWGIPKNRGGSGTPPPDYEKLGLLSTEGTLLLNVDENDRGLYGLFAARPGSAARVFGIIAGVHLSDGSNNQNEVRDEINALFMFACNEVRRASGVNDIPV